MSKFKLFITAFAVASCVHVTEIQDWTTCAPLVLAAMSVAIVAWSRPPWAPAVVVFAATWWMAPFYVTLLVLLWVGLVFHSPLGQHNRHAPRLPARRLELTSSNSTGSRGLAKSPGAARVRKAGGGTFPGNASGGPTLGPPREQWLDAIARATWYRSTAME